MTGCLLCLIFSLCSGPFARVTAPSQPLPIVQASRHLLERTLRRFVQQHPKVAISYGAAATGLIFDDTSSNSSYASVATGSSSNSSSNRRVVGARLADGRSLRGDLVVAAAGRRLQLQAWLQREGWPAAPVTAVNVNTAYTTW
jgi:2-polyprenyl-6-methoxyphenol hydroxylase-like FAD-dependent oxidoreductase